MTPRRFPPPGTVNEHNRACFIVKDATDEALFVRKNSNGRISPFAIWVSYTGRPSEILDLGASMLSAARLKLAFLLPGLASLGGARIASWERHDARARIALGATVLAPSRSPRASVPQRRTSLATTTIGRQIVEIV
jgi:hypothetical protein